MYLGRGNVSPVSSATIRPPPGLKYKGGGEEHLEKTKLVQTDYVLTLAGFSMSAPESHTG